MFSFSGCEQHFPIYKVLNDIPFDSADKYYNVPTKCNKNCDPGFIWCSVFPSGKVGRLVLI